MVPRSARSQQTQLGNARGGENFKVASVYVRSNVHQEDSWRVAEGLHPPVSSCKTRCPQTPARFHKTPVRYPGCRCSSGSIDCVAIAYYSSTFCRCSTAVKLNKFCGSVDSVMMAPVESTARVTRLNSIRNHNIHRTVSAAQLCRAQ